jgi:hypothetical protein
MKKYTPIASSVGYQISSIPAFSLAKDGERWWLSKLRTRYTKVVGGHKDIENNFYSNDSPNNDLESII